VWKEEERGRHPRGREMSMLAPFCKAVRKALFADSFTRNVSSFEVGVDDEEGGGDAMA
jgi:hypothetical protein